MQFTIRNMCDYAKHDRNMQENCMNETVHVEKSGGKGQGV